MKNRIGYIIAYILGGISLYLYLNHKDNTDDLIEANKVSEAKVLQLQDSLLNERKISDSLDVENELLTDKILKQKEDIVYVKQKYDKQRSNIVNLNSMESVQLLSIYLSKGNCP